MPGNVLRVKPCLIRGKDQDQVDPFFLQNLVNPVQHHDFLRNHDFPDVIFPCIGFEIDIAEKEIVYPKC